MLLPAVSGLQQDYVMTVMGPLHKYKMGKTLVHEHILVDFIGAAEVSADRYNIEEAFAKALPHLTDIVKLGCKTLIECTPAYLGRDVLLLRKLSEATGLHLITNTGYYGASREKFIPPHAYTISAQQLADIWIKEWKEGIDNTATKPGFIKSGVDTAPLSAMQRKLITASCLTHLSTGLPFAVHTGNGAAALEQYEIIRQLHVSPEAWIWVHAQSEKDTRIHLRLAKAGTWISFDGLNKDNTKEYLQLLRVMKREHCLHRVLISHDAGWYNVGSENGGTYSPHTTAFNSFIPMLLTNGFTTGDIEQVFEKNPADAFTIRVRKS